MKTAATLLDRTLITPFSSMERVPNFFQILFLYVYQQVLFFIDPLSSGVEGEK